MRAWGSRTGSQERTSRLLANRRNCSSSSHSSAALPDLRRYKELRKATSSRASRYDRTDSPVNPTDGKSFSFSSKFEGGPLQGNVNSVQAVFSMRYFRPNYHHRNVIGVHLQTAMISGYGGKDAPPYNRFYMGGEYDIRGFEAYTISPFVAIPSSGSTTVSYLDPTKIGSTGQPLPQTIPVSTLQYFPDAARRRYAIHLEHRVPDTGLSKLCGLHDLQRFRTGWNSAQIAVGAESIGGSFTPGAISESAFPKPDNWQFAATDPRNEFYSACFRRPGAGGSNTNHSGAVPLLLRLQLCPPDGDDSGAMRGRSRRDSLQPGRRRSRRIFLEQGAAGRVALRRAADANCAAIEYILADDERASSRGTDRAQEHVPLYGQPYFLTGVRRLAGTGPEVKKRALLERKAV